MSDIDPYDETINDNETINPDMSYSRDLMIGDPRLGFRYQHEEVGRGYHTMLQNLEYQKMQYQYSLNAELSILQHNLRMQEIEAMKGTQQPDSTVLALQQISSIIGQLVGATPQLASPTYAALPDLRTVSSEVIDIPALEDLRTEDAEDTVPIIEEDEIEAIKQEPIEKSKTKQAIRLFKNNDMRSDQNYVVVGSEQAQKLIDQGCKMEGESTEDAKRAAAQTNSVFENGGMIANDMGPQSEIVDANDSRWVIEEYGGDGQGPITDQSLLTETVPLNANDWIQAQYDLKWVSKVDMYYHKPLKEAPSDNYAEFDHSQELEVYRHLPYSGYKQHVGSDSSKKSWEAFDIPFKAFWKQHIARYIGGITKADAAIIRILNKTNPTHPGFYLSVYMNTEDLSTFLDKLEAEAKTPAERYNQSLSYHDTSRNDPASAHFISLLEYAYTLNKKQPFYIIEQLADYRYGGNSSLLLSSKFPKTELREEYNIFMNRPSSVFTNYKQQILMCIRDDAAERFLIKKFRSQI